MVNKVILTGNIGKEPEVRQDKKGGNIVNFSMATSEVYKDKVSGEKKENTEWHRLVAFGKIADIISKYVKKGDKLYIEGKLRTQKYEKDGAVKYSTEIIVSSVEFLGGGKGSVGADKEVKSSSPDDVDIPDYAYTDDSVDSTDIPF